jgi:hypothetical protein
MTSVRWTSFFDSLFDTYSRAELTWLGKARPSRRIEVPASSGEEIEYFRDILLLSFRMLLESNRNERKWYPSIMSRGDELVETDRLLVLSVRDG